MTMILGLILALGGCSSVRERCSNALLSPDVKIINYHVKKHYESIRTLANRLYAKNPCYEPDPERRRAKIRAIFGETSPYTIPYELRISMSHQLLEASFAPTPPERDRVLVFILGLKKGVDEAYNTGHGPFLTGCQIDVKRLERLYSNISQAKWRLKTYRDQGGHLMFITNQALDNGYINMGFEVILTQMLTRIQDDIYLRSGLESNLTFRLSTIFLSIL
ncbi:MAG: hypothetical protein GXO58_10475 [Thermodesulfobacteria bacterium]|nr:hypothetical protein [Thermodesulfobacteriota bacterium]